jgi:RNA polymerase sigma-70 factor (ECF subfamily)
MSEVAARDKAELEPEELDDARLARALIEGRAEAALVAWERFQPTVQVTLLRMLGPGHDLEDMVQEVFLRFFDRIREVRKQHSLRPYIIGIAIRRAQEEIRRRQVRRRLAPLLPMLLRPTSTQIDEHGRDALVHFYRALDHLSVEDRTLYVLRFIEELDHVHMSELMDMSVATVRRRLDRLSLRMDALINADPVLADYVAQLRLPAAAAVTSEGGGPRK